MAENSEKNKKSWIKRHLFSEEDLALNSVKEITKSLDSNIDKLAQLFRENQHYIRYSLLGTAGLSLCLIIYKFRSLQIAKNNLVHDIKKRIYQLDADSHVSYTFTKQNRIPPNGLHILHQHITKLRRQQPDPFKQVHKYYEHTLHVRVPVHLISPAGSGKTEMLRQSFLKLRMANRPVAYIDAKLAKKDTHSLLDLLYPELNRAETEQMRQNLNEFLSKRKRQDAYILLDNCQGLNKIDVSVCEDIDYYRRIGAINFLFCSDRASHNLQQNVLIQQHYSQGYFQDSWYQSLVRSLNLGQQVQQEVFQWRPNLYVLQDLYQVEAARRMAVLRELRSR